MSPNTPPTDPEIACFHVASVGADAEPMVRATSPAAGMSAEEPPAFIPIPPTDAAAAAAHDHRCAEITLTEPQEQPICAWTLSA